jgi:sigma-B regulation protein RsbU (phosphoserine phosphatase)
MGLLDEQIERDVALSRILVVDDNAVSLAIIARFLTRAGFSGVAFAEGGAAALAMIETAPPDLVLLDLNMPGMTGAEMLRRLRATPEGRTVPVIIQTANDSPETRAHLFSLGASDFVGKPIDLAELEARVKVHLRNRVLYKSQERHLARIEGELADARRAQWALLPSPTAIADIERRFDLGIDSYYQPSSELAGDLWGCKEIDGRILLYLLDITGHGVSAALDAFRLRAIIDSMGVPDAAEPSRLLEGLNGNCHRAFPRGRFGTMTAVVVDPGAGTLAVSSAGAPGLIFGQGRGDPAAALDGRGAPLGLRPQATYQSRTLRLGEEGFALLYSDGLSESAGGPGAGVGEGGPVGEEGMLRLAERVRREDRPLAALIDALGGDGHPAIDDRTAVWVRMRSRSA